MDIVDQQFKTRNYITPRDLNMIPLSIPVSNKEDIVNNNDTRLNAEIERKWVRSVNSHQFWSYQYMEHSEMISLIISSLGNKFDNYVKEADVYKKLWLSTYENLMLNDKRRISKNLLKDFRSFKLSLLKDLMKANWIGWAPLSLYEHMIRETEYLQTPHTALKIISFWLTDMEGHAELDSSWTDPAHEELVKKAKEIAMAYGELKKRVGQGEGRQYFNLLARRDIDDKNIHDIIVEGEKVEKLETVLGDLKELLARLIILQNGLTKFHLEYKVLYDNGKIFTNMTESFINHTLRESMRANYELEELSYGRIVD